MTKSAHIEIKKGDMAIVFFDLDGTLLKGESQFSFLFWCIKRDAAPFCGSLSVALRYVLYISGYMKNASSVRDSGLSLLKNMRVDVLSQLTSVFFDSILRQKLYPGVQSLLGHHRKAGHKVVLMTSVIEALAAQAASYLGLTQVHATRLLERDGVLTGQYAKPVPYGMGKRELAKICCHRMGVSPHSCFAYCDHLSDLPLLEFVGHPVATNPSTPLAKIAVKRRWHILDLTRTPDWSFERLSVHDAKTNDSLLF